MLLSCPHASGYLSPDGWPIQFEPIHVLLDEDANLPRHVSYCSCQLLEGHSILHLHALSATSAMPCCPKRTTTPSPYHPFQPLCSCLSPPTEPLTTRHCRLPVTDR